MTGALKMGLLLRRENINVVWRVSFYGNYTLFFFKKKKKQFELGIKPEQQPPLLNSKLLPHQNSALKLTSLPSVPDLRLLICLFEIDSHILLLSPLG